MGRRMSYGYGGGRSQLAEIQARRRAEEDAARAYRAAAAGRATAGRWQEAFEAPAVRFGRRLSVVVPSTVTVAGGVRAVSDVPVQSFGESLARRGGQQVLPAWRSGRNASGPSQGRVAVPRSGLPGARRVVQLPGRGVSHTLEEMCDPDQASRIPATRPVWLARPSCRRRASASEKYASSSP